MRNTTYKHVYNFDTLGRLESSYETRKDDGSKDTSWNIYTYDDRSNLIRHKWTDLDGYQIIEYTYDSLDRVIQEHYSREYIDSAGNIERSLSFNTETSEYADYDRQTKRTHYNNYNLPYLDEFLNYNELGYLVERVERIKMTSTVYTYDYSYNEQGKLAAIRKSSNQHEGFLEEHLFEYDELGNLIEKHEHRNGEFITDIQIIYNSKSKLISSVLTKQVSTGFFLILRFHEYEFYD